MSLKLNEYLATIELVKNAFADLSKIALEGFNFENVDPGNFNTTDYDSTEFYNNLWKIDKGTARSFAKTRGLSYNGIAIDENTKDVNAIYGALIQYAQKDGKWDIDRVNTIMSLNANTKEENK
jgi:hypothetical protein